MTLSVLVIFGCLALGPQAARAFEYTDQQNQIRLDVPEGESIYYYTPERSNLFEDLAEQVQNSGRDVRVLVRAYTDQDLLGYSLEVAAVPSPGNVPAGGGVPQGSNLRDAQLYEEGERSLVEATVRMAYEGRFNFSAPQNGKLGDINCLVMRGTGVDGTGWAPYDCDVYLIASSGDMLMVSLIYEANASNGYREQGDALLSSLAIGPAALATPTPEPAAETGSVAQQPASAAQPSVQGTPMTENPFDDMGAAVKAFWQEHQTICWIGIGAVAAIILIVALSHRRKDVSEEEARAAEQASAAKARAEAKAEAAKARAEIAQAEADAREREERARRAAEEAERERREREAAEGPREPQPRKEGTRRQIGMPAPSVSARSRDVDIPLPRGTRRRIAAPVPEGSEDTRPIPPTEASDRRMREWERAEAARRAAATQDAAEELEAAPQERDGDRAYGGHVGQPYSQARRLTPPQAADDMGEYGPPRERMADREQADDEIYEEDQADMGADGHEYRGRNYDYTDDVSRYTQQPGPDVNDVSRYTHGGEASELDDLMDMPYGSTRSTSQPAQGARRPSVGSRVERNRRRKRR